MLRACARSLCKAEVKLGTRATPNLKFCRSNSLIPSKNSLFFEIFSLIIRLGNCARNRCSTAVSCIKLGSEGARIAKFPVKFPVSWESGWRRVAISTASPASQSLNRRLLGDKFEKCPPVAAFCRFAFCLHAPNLHNLRAKSPIVSSPRWKYSRFWETRARDRARSALRGVRRS